MVTRQRRLHTVVVAVALVVGACSADDDTRTAGTPADIEPAGDSSPTTVASTTTGAERTAAEDERMCAALDATDPPPDLVDLVPAEHVETVQLILDVTDPLGSDTGIPRDLAVRLADAGDDLTAFGDMVEEACGTTDVVASIRLFAAASTLAASPTAAEYCGPLADVVSLEVDEADRAPAIAAALATAPPEHVGALEIVRALSEGEVGTDAGPAPEDARAAIAGLGLYAEARCDVTDAFAAMLIIGAFLSDDFEPFDESVGLGAVPEPADATAANAAVPAGTDLAFEVTQLDLGDDGEYFVSAVVPVGWEADAGLFGIEYEPADGFSIFTEVSFDSGCDGLCEVTDWEARLTGADGIVTQFRADGDLAVDRPTVGTAGVVLVRRGASGEADGAVFRWAEGIDRYFACRFELDDDDAALADALVAACEGSRPGWVEAAS